VDRGRRGSSHRDEAGCCASVTLPPLVTGHQKKGSPLASRKGTEYVSSAVGAYRCEEVRGGGLLAGSTPCPAFRLRNRLPDGNTANAKIKCGDPRALIGHQQLCPRSADRHCNGKKTPSLLSPPNGSARTFSAPADLLRTENGLRGSMEAKDVGQRGLLLADSQKRPLLLDRGTAPITGHGGGMEGHVKSAAG
jgi:hypothetical protein